jgi:hypothetical protein
MGEAWLDELEQLFGPSSPTPPVEPQKPQRQFHMADPDQPACLQKCPLCQGPMAERNGKNGTFLGCKGYPNCKGTRNYPK